MGALTFNNGGGLLSSVLLFQFNDLLPLKKHLLNIALTPVLLNCLFLFFIHLKLTQFPASNRVPPALKKDFFIKTQQSIVVSRPITHSPTR